MAKKTMIAIAALCGAVAAQAVESDVVGYTTSDLKEGNSAKSASFAPVSGGALDLQDIKVVGYDGETAGDVNAQTLDKLGRTIDTYFWADLPDDDIYGWLDGNDELVEGVSVSAGEGLWVNAPSSDYKIQTSGKVPNTDVAVTLREGNLMVGNPMPTSIGLQSIIVTGYDGETAGDVNAQTLDKLGRTIDTYFWVDLPDDDIYGWLDGNDELVENVSLASGDALWINAPSTDYQVVFPTPLN